MAMNDRVAAYRVSLLQIAPDDIEIRVGGVGKQHHGEASAPPEGAIRRRYVDAQQAQPIGAEAKAENREHDRAADQGPLDPGRPL